MQTVECAHAKALTMAAGEFAAAREGTLRDYDLKPEACGSVRFKLAGHAFGFRSLHDTAEHVLGDGVGPLGQMKWSEVHLVR